MSHLWHNVRYGIRVFFRKPEFTAAALLGAGQLMCSERNASRPANPSVLSKTVLPFFSTRTAYERLLVSTHRLKISVDDGQMLLRRNRNGT